jgi:hypothetical protein
MLLRAGSNISTREREKIPCRDQHSYYNEIPVKLREKRSGKSNIPSKEKKRSKSGGWNSSRKERIKK